MNKPAPSFIRQLDTHIHQPVNCLTHLVGAVFSAVGTVVLLAVSWGNPLYVVSYAVYGVSSVLLYSASSLFHGLKVGPAGRRRLLQLDHVGIYILIAGSYTPIALILLKSHSAALGWTFLAVVWLAALLGSVSKLYWLDAPRPLSTGFYLVLGWAILFAMPALTQVLAPGGLMLLFVGGLLYSVGAVVFVLERPNFYPGVLGHHELWHLFVLAGGSSYYLMLLLHATPTGS